MYRFGRSGVPSVAEVMIAAVFEVAPGFDDADVAVTRFTGANVDFTDADVDFAAPEFEPTVCFQSKIVQKI